MAARERKVVSPDLDIFGDSAEVSEEERAADKASMDIFGEDGQAAEAEATDAETADGAEAGASEAGAEGAGSEEGEPDWASIFGDEGAEGEPSEKPEEEGKEGEESELDPEIEDLLKQVEETEESDERDDVIADLRARLTQQQVELDTAVRRAEVLNEKLMASSATDTEYGMYKDTIAKLESEPQLKALIRYYGADDERSKDRAVGLLADMVEKLTGQDVGSLLDKSRSDKTKAALGASPSAAPSKEAEEEKPMDYEDSISRLW